MSITEFQFLFETDKSLQRTLKLPMDKNIRGFVIIIIMYLIS